jgi:transposase InsO family protein
MRRLIGVGTPRGLQGRLQAVVQERLRDECLNEHWFTSVAHAQAVIETWRREYNDERPKKDSAGSRPPRTHGC